MSGGGGESCGGAIVGGWESGGGAVVEGCGGLRVKAFCEVLYITKCVICFPVNLG